MDSTGVKEQSSPIFLSVFRKTTIFLVGYRNIPEVHRCSDRREVLPRMLVPVGVSLAVLTCATRGLVGARKMTAFPAAAMAGS